jgi:DNA-binding CsgD family transcriptional regulator
MEYPALELEMNRSGRLLLELYQGARELPIPEFQEMALGLLKGIIRFDSGMWGYGDVLPGKGLVVQAIHLHQQPEEMLTSYAEIKDHDLAAFEAARHIGKICNFNLRELMAGSGQDMFATHRRKYAMENLLVATVEDKAMCSRGFLSLWRAKERDCYSEEERSLGEFFMPHIFEAGTINHLLWLNKMTEDTVAKRGARAISNCLGNLQTGDSEFVSTLRKEWPDWSPPILPQTLMVSLKQSSEQRYIGRHITVTMNIIQEMLFLLARPNSAVEILTPAEFAVATHVANGLSYKEAAKRFGLSPSTVRNHLHRVYLKLGVKNKAALAMKFGKNGI